MGALRKAGVWLGLIEDEDDRGYDGHGYDDDFEDEVDEAPVAVRPRAAVAERLAEAREAGRAGLLTESRDRTERTSVRPATRSPSTATTSYPTRDNLALAPQVQLRERAVVTDDPEERRYQITTLHPTTYNEARTIGEHFRDGVPVIMNLTEMAEADAKRLVDFAAGLAFGLRGSMERVTNRVFLLSPANVQVTAEDKARIAEGGFFNQS
jgi:cell division inhibitor SepF